MSAQGFDTWVSQALEAPADPGWTLLEDGYHPMRESAVESRFAVSNGLLGVRGSRAGSRGPTWASWLHHLTWASWPRTFVAGLFETPNTEPAVPALVPAPDWLRFRILLDGEPLLLRTGELLVHRRVLDMRRGLLHVQWKQRDGRGRTVDARSIRLVSAAERSLGLQVLRLEVDQPAQVTFEAWLEVSNAGLEVQQVQPSLGVWRAAASGKRLAVATAAELRLDGRLQEPLSQIYLTRIWQWPAVPGQAATFWRMAGIDHADGGDGEVARRAEAALARAVEAGPPAVLAAHQEAWASRWDASDVEVAGDPLAQQALRFAAYHLIAAANPEDERVSIGARALTGDAYLGHVFWDTEIYLLPFYTFTWPAAARALLMYRYHTLPAARAKAARLGYRGALYAWESADTGEETTPDFITGPDGRPLIVLCGRLEQHISADVAYAVWQYWEATRDESFLLDAGAEILLETARFWASRATREADGRYHIRDVIGPDEYHEHVDDNAYTNVMAQWNIERGLEAAALLRERWPERWATLERRMDIGAGELQAWEAAAEYMATRVDPKTGLLEQFEGYFDLEPVDLSRYEGRTVSMEVVLGRERLQRSQVLKQADTVALMALLPARFSRRARAANFRYYAPRTDHGSSLSRPSHAVVAARLGQTRLADRYFREAALADLEGTSPSAAGGVRIAALGGLWQVAVLGFVGLALRPDGVAIDPRLPRTWEAVRFRVQWRGRRLHLDVDRPTGRVRATLEAGPEMTLHVGRRAHLLRPGLAELIPWRPPEALEEAA